MHAFTGAELETEVASADDHEALAGFGASSREDLHRQVGYGDIVGCGVVWWCGVVVWRGVVWCGGVLWWCGVVWCGGVV